MLFTTVVLAAAISVSAFTAGAGQCDVPADKAGLTGMKDRMFMVGGAEVMGPANGEAGKEVTLTIKASDKNILGWLINAKAGDAASGTFVTTSSKCTAAGQATHSALVNAKMTEVKYTIDAAATGMIDFTVLVLTGDKGGGAAQVFHTGTGKIMIGAAAGTTTAGGTTEKEGTATGTPAASGDCGTAKTCTECVEKADCTYCASVNTREGSKGDCRTTADLEDGECPTLSPTKITDKGECKKDLNDACEKNDCAACIKADGCWWCNTGAKVGLDTGSCNWSADKDGDCLVPGVKPTTDAKECSSASSIFASATLLIASLFLFF